MAWFEPKPLLIPDIIEMNRSFLGNKPAVIIDDDKVSWTAFGNGTTQFANALLDSGLSHGDRVIVLMKNSYEMVEAMFGVIRAGLVAVPLNVSITDDAIAGMIGNSEAKAVVASGEHVQRVEALRERVAHQLDGRFIAPDSQFDGWIDYTLMRDAASTAPPPVSIDATGGKIRVTTIAIGIGASTALRPFPGIAFVTVRTKIAVIAPAVSIRVITASTTQ